MGARVPVITLRCGCGGEGHNFRSVICGLFPRGLLQSWTQLRENGEDSTCGTIVVCLNLLCQDCHVVDKNPFYLVAKPHDVLVLVVLPLQKRGHHTFER